ncbi:unnamed protein product, partial [Meganyctiphanes norvegica]
SLVPLIIKMKVVLAVLAFAAAAQAAPHTILGGAAIPIDGGYPYTDALGFSIPKALPVATYSHAAVAPAISYSHLPAIAPLTYSHIPAVAPLTYAVSPAVAPGYVAKTLGATHIAPLPAGIGYASHHINLAAAPGTEE